MKYYANQIIRRNWAALKQLPDGRWNRLWEMAFKKPIPAEINLETISKLLSSKGCEICLLRKAGNNLEVSVTTEMWGWENEVMFDIYRIFDEIERLLGKIDTIQGQIRDIWHLRFQGNQTIGIIGDIHTEAKLLDKTVAFMKSQKVDIILSVGDIVDGFGDADECCNILRREEISVVLGNHDRWFLNNELRDLKTATQPDSLSVASHSFLQSLPATFEFVTPHGLALLCHGLGKNDMCRLTPDDFGYAIEVNADLQNLIKEQKYRYVFNGHTHYKMVRHFGNLTIINAGTLKQEEEPGFVTIDFVRQFVQFYKFLENGAIEPAERINLTKLN